MLSAKVDPSVIRSMSGKKVEDAGKAPLAGSSGSDPLGERLRDLFRAVETAPVPEEIRRLVDDLEKKRRGRGRAPKRN